MNIEQLYKDYGVTYVTEGHKHCREGWVQVECPFCTGNPGYHLGYDTELDRFVCWRCGGKHPVQALAGVLRIPPFKAEDILRQYNALPTTNKRRRSKEKQEFILPSNCEELKEIHKRYLENRGYDPEEIIRLWKVQGTGVFSKLDTLDYKHRIIIPFYWNGQMVTFDSRDITGKHRYKYYACPLEREGIPHKDILYGIQSGWSSTGICVEGPTDVWRMGIRSFATSGIKYTAKQVRLMARTFDRIAVCYDDDPQAIIQANKLVADLKFRGVDAFRVPIVGDPGSMSQQEANYLVKQLI
jgi:hypothetical protein